jgi:hypothetical protein
MSVPVRVAVCASVCAHQVMCMRLSHCSRGAQTPLQMITPALTPAERVMRNYYTPAAHTATAHSGTHTSTSTQRATDSVFGIAAAPLPLSAHTEMVRVCRACVLLCFVWSLYAGVYAVLCVLVSASARSLTFIVISET